MEMGQVLGIREGFVMLPEVEDLPDFFANKAGVLLEGGDGLFVGNARGHIRLNLAMPRATVQIGLERIAEAIRKELARGGHTVVFSFRFCSRALGSVMCSISPGARRSRLKAAILFGPQRTVMVLGP